MENFKKLLDGIKGIGLGNALRTIIYTNRKKKADKAYWSVVNKQGSELRIPGKLSDVKVIENGARASFQNEIELEIVFLKKDMVRTTWTPGNLPVQYAVIKDDWSDVDVKVEQVDDSWVVSSDELKLQIHPCGSVSYFEGKKLIRQENPPRLEGKAWTQTAELESETKIFGMGEQANRLDLRGNSFELWNTDPGGSYKFQEGPLYMPLPVYYCSNSNRGHMVFHENTFKGKLSFKEEIEVNFIGGALRTYFIKGEIKKVIGKLTELTGRSPLPPLWALGFHQSKWGYKNEGDIRRIAKGYLDNDLPISVIHMDIDYMEGFRVFTIDSERYPDLKSLTADMEEQGIKLITILDPAVKVDKDYPIYQEGIENSYFCTTPEGQTFKGLVWPGWAAFPDFTNPKTREWWKGKYSALLDEGISGIWHDMNEPASFVSDGDSTLPLSTLHNLEGKKGNHAEAHNVYGMNMNRAGYEAMRELRPDRRPWLLTRSGWVGVQRYAWHWTADIESSWDALKMTVSGLLNLGISGISFSGSDIGGFSGKADTELFIRWFQLAAFTPFFRNHASCQTPDSEPWEYGQIAVDIIREVLRVRERLLPYIYTCSWQASEFGFPLMRPMFWDQDDGNLSEIEDSFFFGDHLLVAPVLEEGQKERDVYFPEGAWIDFYDGSVYEGDREYIVKIQIDKIPVFVRSGAVIPVKENSSRILRLYAAEGTRGSTTSYIYSDSGDGYGASMVEEITVEQNEGHININRMAKGEYYPQE